MTDRELLEFIAAQVGKLTNEMDDMKLEVSSTNGEIKSLKDEISSTNGEIKSLKNEVSSTNDEVKSLKNEVSSTNGEIKSLKDEINSTNGEIKSLKDIVIRIENDHGRKLDALFDGYKQNSEKLTRIDEMISHIQTDVGNLTIKTNYNDKRIIELSKRGGKVNNE